MTATDHTLDKTTSGKTAQAEFIPTCPSCGYELARLLNGMCPECGAVFDREALYAAHLLRRAERERVLNLIRPTSWSLFVIIVGCAGGLGNSDQGTVFFRWVVLGSILFLVRKPMYRSRWLTILLVGGSMGLVLLGWKLRMSPYGGAAEGLAYLWSLLGWSAALCAAPALFGRWRWMLWAWASLLVGIGTTIGSSGMLGVLEHEHWSGWFDLRWWDPYLQYPMSNSDATRFGGSIVLIGLVMMLVVRRIEPVRTQNNRAGCP